MTVLLVDDDPAIRLVVTYALTHIGGHRVIAVGSGAEALSALGAPPAPPDLLLLDCHLEGESGADVLRTLRALPGMQHVPVIWLTGRAPSEVSETLAAPGVLGVLSKPFDPLALNAEIERLVAGAAER